MNELSGIESRPRLTDRLFFAVVPDASAVAAIERLSRRLMLRHGLRGKPIPPARLHATLHFLGNHAGFPQALADAAAAAAATVGWPPFEVSFDRVLSFGRAGKKPFALVGGKGVDDLKAFQAALGMALRDIGSQHRAAVYLPHVTLSHDEQAVVEQAVERISWAVHDFVLFDSLLGQGIHRPLARWALRG